MSSGENDGDLTRTRHALVVNTDEDDASDTSTVNQDDEYDVEMGKEGVAVVETSGNTLILAGSPLELKKTTWAMMSRNKHSEQDRDRGASIVRDRPSTKVPPILSRTFSAQDPMLLTATNLMLSFNFTKPPKSTPEEQGNKCYSCQEIVSGKMRFCHYSQAYYCTNCHVNDVSVILHYVLTSWNFKKYPVGRYCKRFIDEHYDTPDINVAEHAPELYSKVSALAKTYALRCQLRSVYDFIQPCSNNEVVMSVLDKRFYIIDPHVYSISDLLDVDNGDMETYLDRLIRLCLKHAQSCEQCMLRAKPCAICRLGGVLFPFQNGVYICPGCHETVVHVICRGKVDRCPTCNTML